MRPQLLTTAQLKHHPYLKYNFTKKECENTWNLLTKWATNSEESKIVRVTSIQGLFNLLQQNRDLSKAFNLTLSAIEKEKIPSLNARMKKIQKAKPLNIK